MEPMTLGSPAGSPSPAQNTFLPSFLIGESNIPSTPRNNTLSPTKGRSLAFEILPRNTPTSPPNPHIDYAHQQRTIGFQGTPQASSSLSSSISGPPSKGLFDSLQTERQQINQNQSISGPPTQGLFDSLQAERSFVENTGNVSFAQQSQPLRSLVPAGGGYNYSMQFNQSAFNDSYLNQSDFNVSKMGPPMSRDTPDFRSHNAISSPFSDCASSPPPMRNTNFWITVYGFPQQSTSIILSHFSQCGTIFDKIFPPQMGNWVHLKFSSRLECDRALNYHERIIGGNLMIGVTYCKDPTIVDKENIDRGIVPINRVRPLTHAAYQSAQAPTEVITSPTVPKRSTGLMNKAMDMIFGW